MSQNTLQELRPLDEPLLHQLMSDLPLAQMVLRLITGVDELELVEETVGKDSNGKKYVFEIQKEEVPFNVDRTLSRMVTMVSEHWNSILEKENLPALYLIIITEADPFGHAEPIYRFSLSESNRHEPLTGADHILYVNGTYEGDDEIGRLMHDFRCTDPNDMYLELLAEKVRCCKENLRGDGIIN